MSFPITFSSEPLFNVLLPEQTDAKEHPVNLLSRRIFSNAPHLYSFFTWEPSPPPPPSPQEKIEDLLKEMKDGSAKQRLENIKILLASFFLEEDEFADGQEIMGRFSLLKDIVPHLLETLCQQAKSHPSEKAFCHDTLLFIALYTRHFSDGYPSPFSKIKPLPKTFPYLPDTTFLIEQAKKTHSSNFDLALMSLGNLSNDNLALSQRISKPLLPRLLKHYPKASAKQQASLLMFFINLSCQHSEAISILSRSAIFHHFFASASPNSPQTKKNYYLQMELLNNVLAHLSPNEKVKFLKTEWIQRLVNLAKESTMPNCLANPKNTLMALANASPTALQQVLQTGVVDLQSIKNYQRRAYFRNSSPYSNSYGYRGLSSH